MKKIISLKLVAVLMAALVPLLSTAVNSITYTSYYTATPVIGTDTLGGVTYATFHYGDLKNNGAPGKPSLPVDYIRFSVPYNATNFTVTTNPRAWTNYNLGRLLYPCQASFFPDGPTVPSVTLPDSTAYFSGGSYPSEMAWVVDEGFLAGENHIVTVAVVPFKYQHTSTSDIVRKVHHVYVTLNYDLSNSLATYPIVREDSALREEGFRLTQSMVVNPNQVPTYSYNPPVGSFDPGPINPGNPVDPNGGGVNGGDYPIFPPDNPGGNAGYGGELFEAYPRFSYLIVTTNELYHSMRRLAALKRQKGYNVKTVTMNQVMSDTCANMGDVMMKPDSTYHVAYNDPAGILRQYIRNCFTKNGTRYVLLAGDSIPYRHREDVANDGFSGPINIDCISDFYYSELNSDWSEDTIKDYVPDLYVGRILATEPAQIDNYTDKLFRYELNPGNGNYSYLRRAIIQDGEDFNTSHVKFKRYLNEMSPQIFTHLTELPKNILGQNVIDTLNTQPAGLISIFNHGDTTKIMVYGGNEIPTRHYIYSTRSETFGDGLNCMHNKNYPTIFYSSSCATVPFDNKTGINMGESFTTGKDYGGPVYMGYTRICATETMRDIISNFAIRIKSGYYTLGIADALSVWDYCDARLKLQNPSLIHAYIGDPSVEIWTAKPHLYRSIYVTRTDHSINILGIDKDSTIVAYCDNNYTFRQTVNSYNVSLDCSPNASVMIYRHNCIPYIIPTVFQNVNLYGSKYMIAGDFMAGNSVDSNRTNGNVIVKQGANYEIEAAGTTRLCGGFQVELGASFSVVPSSFEDEQYLY